MKQVKDSSAEDSTSKTRLKKVKQMWIYTKNDGTKMFIHTQSSIKN